jgi:hypothetical protein
MLLKKSATRRQHAIIDSWFGSRIGRVHEQTDVRGCSYQVVQQSSRFDTRLELNWVTPVMLRPGRFRLATKPSVSGSPAVSNTIGMVVVAALITSAAGVPPAAITFIPGGREWSGS